MNFRYFLITLFISGVSCAIAQVHLKDAHYMKTCKSIYDAITTYHISPKPIDDEYSKIVFQNTIESINEKGILFTTEDLKKLSKFETSLDEELKGGSLQFINGLSVVYTKRLKAINEILDKLLVDKINYINNDSIYWGGDASDFSPVNDQELEKAWKRKIKMSVLLGLSTDLTIKDLKSPEFATKEAAIKKKVITKLLKAISNKLSETYGMVDRLYSSYFDCMISCQDAHSNFISKDVWMQFHDDLSKTESQFGFNIKESEAGEVQIASVSPGSPAWKVNVIHADDILRKIKLNNVSLDFSELDIDELYTQIRSPKVTFIEMELQKADGTSVIVNLTKEVILNEDNAIKSYVLKKDKKIGYLALPGFYFDSEQNEFGLGCANDVAKEIMKLKAEGVEGLVFDLRYNGGGSMKEVQDLLGLFINEGPLFSIIEKETGAKLMKDPNRGSLFDQPMVVMVNGQSASASEIFASTLQDYNRAVIVGSKTYGKATGQITIPLGIKLENLTADSYAKSTEGLKVTIMKIFRLSGKSNQKIGVQPDVVLPDLFEKIDYNEATSPFALPNELTSKIPVIKTLPKLPIASLMANSEARQKENADFKKTKDLIEKTPRALQKTEGGMPMTLANVRYLNTEYTTWLDAVKQIKKQVVKYYEVIPTKIDGKLAGMDDIYKNTQLETMKEIESDFYLQESFKVISDLLNIKK